MPYKTRLGGRFLLQTPRSNAGRFCYVLASLRGSARAQARLVHHGIDSAEQIHIEETGIALIPGVDEYSFFFSAD